MKPTELYEMNLICFGDMVLAKMKADEEAQDLQMQMLAWQTALIMNSSGNYKKPVKPEKLYTPRAEAKKKEKNQLNKTEVIQDKKKLQEELLSAFADSDVVIT